MTTAERHQRQHEKKRQICGFGTVCIPMNRQSEPKTIEDVKNLTVAKVRKLPVGLDIITSRKGKLCNRSILIVLFFCVRSEMDYVELRDIRLETLFKSARNCFNALWILPNSHQYF